MTDTSIHTREALPPEMRHLLRDYPRDAWPDHPNFATSIANWMGAHQMFRRLGGHVRVLTEGFIDRETAPETFADRLAWSGNLLVANLHGHHTWEDRDYFPELRRADGRFADGLDMLEGDHQVLDATLERLTGAANRVIKLIGLDEAQARDEAGALHGAAAELEGFLARHLEDEEDLVVPILLHHKLRG